MCAIDLLSDRTIQYTSSAPIIEHLASLGQSIHPLELLGYNAIPGLCLRKGIDPAEELIRYLNMREVHSDAVDDRGITPLMFATQRDRLDTINE